MALIQVSGSLPVGLSSPNSTSATPWPSVPGSQASTARPIRPVRRRCPAGGRRPAPRSPEPGGPQGRDGRQIRGVQRQSRHPRPRRTASRRPPRSRPCNCRRCPCRPRCRSPWLRSRPCFDALQDRGAGHVSPLAPCQVMVQPPAGCRCRRRSCRPRRSCRCPGTGAGSFAFLSSTCDSRTACGPGRGAPRCPRSRCRRSASGRSNRPSSNFLVRIRVTASSMRDIGTRPAWTRRCRWR